MQSNNIDDELRGLGFEERQRSASQYDLSGDLGGRIIRNKLWFYGAVRYRDIHRTVLGAFSEAPVDDDLDNIVTAKYITQKYLVSGEPVAPVHRLQPVGAHARKRQDGLAPVLGIAEDKKTAHPICQGRVGGPCAATRSSPHFQFGYAPHDSLAPFLNTGTPQQIGRTDLVTEMVTGENVVAGERSRHFLHQTKGAADLVQAELVSREP